MSKRHKVFISYFHSDDQAYKEHLINMVFYNMDKMMFESVFDDFSVREGDIDDTNMKDETIREKIRDEYIKNATVLILLCGENTSCRKHVDWEINAAMFDSEKNPKMGILAINLPSINQSSMAASNDEKKLISNVTNWVTLVNDEDYENHYPYMPVRIMDNLKKGVPITIVDWDIIKNDSYKLMTFIDNAYNRRKNIEYDHSRPLKRRNS